MLSVYYKQKLTKKQFLNYRLDSQLLPPPFQQFLIYKMTDLNKLFMDKSITPLPSYPPQTTTYGSFRHPHRPESRNLFGTERQTFEPVSKFSMIFRPLSTLSAPFRLTERQFAKTTVNNESMVEQIGYFKRMSNRQLIQKICAVTIPMLLLGLFGVINGKISFQLVIFGASLLAYESAIVENKSLRMFIQTLPTLTYLAMFYDSLTSSNHNGQYYVVLANLPVLIVSICATINFLFLRNMSFLQQQNLHNIRTGSKPSDILQYFYKKYVSRVQNNLKLGVYVLTLNFFLAFIFSIYCLFNLHNVLFAQTVYTIPAGVVVFFILDLFVYTVEFVSRDVYLLKLKEKFYQVPVFMALLRLKSHVQNHEENEKIHQRCLIEVMRRLRHNNDYLQHLVKVNYAINTYRDIFEIYASEELFLLQNIVNNMILLILRNNRFAKSTKTWRQDLFVSVKRVYGKIQNNLLILRILSEIQKRKLIFLILTKLSTLSPLKSKIIESINEIKQNAKRATHAQEYFEIGERKLNDWVSELEQLIKTLNREDIGMRVRNTTEIDQNGWIKYKRVNKLDVLSI